MQQCGKKERKNNSLEAPMEGTARRGVSANFRSGQVTMMQFNEQKQARASVDQELAQKKSLVGSLCIVANGSGRTEEAVILGGAPSVDVERIF